MPTIKRVVIDFDPTTNIHTKIRMEFEEKQSCAVWEKSIATGFEAFWGKGELAQAVHDLLKSCKK